jgi:hypothetical protein
MGRLWEELEHHICTGYGVSDKTYKSAIDKLLYDIGQGRCALPIIWALPNQLLLTALGEKFDCIQLVDIEGAMHTRPGDSFVDDTTTGATNDDVSTYRLTRVNKVSRKRKRNWWQKLRL